MRSHTAAREPAQSIPAAQKEPASGVRAAEPPGGSVLVLCRCFIRPAEAIEQYRALFGSAPRASS